MLSCFISFLIFLPIPYFFWQQPFFGIHRILCIILGDANLGGELWAFFTLPRVSCKSFAHASLSCLASVCGWVPSLKFQCPLLTVNLLFCWKWIKPWVDWCSVNFWAQTVYGQVPFVLVESEAHRHPHRQGEAVFVHVNMDGSQHSLPLVTVFYQLHPVPASSYTFLQAMFGRRYPVCNCLLTIAYTILCTLLFSVPFQVIQHLMTIPVSLQVGLLDEEKILPLGREITAVGVVNTSSDGSPVIKSCNHLPVFL